MKEITTARVVIILFVVVNIAHLPVSVSATSVDKLSICDVEGHAGDVIDIPITLRSTSDSKRAGYWSIFYKKVEGESDDKKMDITDWITITPPNYTLKSGEVKSFTTTISIPGTHPLGYMVPHHRMRTWRGILMREGHISYLKMRMHLLRMLARLP